MAPKWPNGYFNVELAYILLFFCYSLVLWGRIRHELVQMLFFTRLQSCWRSWHNHAGVEILTVKQQGAGAAVRAFIGRPPTPTDGRARATVSTQLWHRAKPRQQSNSGDTAPLEQPGRLDLSLTAAGERRPREAEPPGPAGPHTSRYVYYRRQAGQRTRQPACLPAWADI